MLSHQFYGLNNSGPTLCFLHGFLGSHKDFLPLIHSLSSSHPCLAIDLPAHGNSPPYPGKLLEMVKCLLAPLAHPIFIGYSLGGRIAMQLANELNPTALILLSAHPGLISPKERLLRKKDDAIWAKHLRIMSPHDFLTLWYQRSSFSSLTQKPELLNKLYQQRLYTNSYALADLLEESSLAHMPVYQPLHATYFLYGEHDLAYKTLYRTLYKDIPAIEIPHASHAILIENPTMCLQVIENITN